MRRNSKVPTIVTLSVVASLVRWGHAEQKASTRDSVLSQEDHTEIQQLYARYSQTIHSGDAEGWAHVFTPDGVFGNNRGTQQLTEFAKGIYQRFEGNGRLWKSGLLITPAPEGANGSCYWILFDVRTKEILLSGTYEDTLIKTAAGWRFKQRVANPDKGGKGLPPGYPTAK